MRGSTLATGGGEWIRALGPLAEKAKSTEPHDTITCNATIGSCEKACEWQCALGLLAEIEGGRTTQHNTIIRKSFDQHVREGL